MPLRLSRALTLTAFGVMMAARITLIQAFMALTQMLVMPLFFLSGASCPLRSLPAWLSVLSRFDPITYVVYPMRHAVVATVRTARFEAGLRLAGTGHRCGQPARQPRASAAALRSTRLAESPRLGAIVISADLAA